MKKTLQIANGVALLITIGINYLSNTGWINGQTVGQVSGQYHSLFTPAPYAFSIWGLIYLMLLAFVIYQSLGLFREADNDGFILQIGWWFVISCIANCGWVLAWIYEFTGLSVLMIGVLLFSLLKIVVNTNMERWDAPLNKIFLLWWPFCLYSGWVTVAAIANISAYLTKIGWNGFGISEMSWAIIMVIIAGLINVMMVWTRNMREFALTGIWALIAIAVANEHIHPPIVRAAFIVSLLLLIAVAVHAFKNRATSPFKKIMDNV